MFTDNDGIFLKFKKEWIDELISQYDYVYNLDNVNVGKDKMKCIESIMRKVMRTVLSDVSERSFVEVKKYLVKRFAEYGVDLNAEEKEEGGKKGSSNKGETEQSKHNGMSIGNKSSVSVGVNGSGIYDDNDKENENVLKKKTKRGRKPLIKVDNHNENKSPIKQKEHKHSSSSSSSTNNNNTNTNSSVNTNINTNITTLSSPSSTSSPIKTRSNSKQQQQSPHSPKQPKQSPHSPNKQNKTPVKSPYSSKRKQQRYSSSPLSSSSKQETPSPIRKLSIKPKPIIKNTQLFDSSNTESQISLRSRNNSSSKRSYKSSPSNSKKKFYEELEEQYNVDPRKSPSKFNLTPMKKNKGTKSPNKDKKTPDKQRSNRKENVVYGSNKKDNQMFLGKKRGIQFNMERYIKEFDPKTPVKGIKMLKVRKSPIERKSNKKIKS